MAAYITITDINNICPESTTVSNSALQLYIDRVGQADACLDSNQVPEVEQKFLKLSAVCHMLMRSTGGAIKSESDMDGASVTFDSYKVDGYGLASTTFGQNILSSQYKTCFNFMDEMPNRFMRSFGR